MNVPWHDQLYVAWDLKFFPQQLQVLRGDRYSKVVDRVHRTTSSSINHLHIHHPIIQDTVDPDRTTATTLANLDGFTQGVVLPEHSNSSSEPSPLTRCTGLPGHSHRNCVLFTSQVHDLGIYTRPWLLGDLHISLLIHKRAIWEGGRTQLQYRPQLLGTFPRTPNKRRSTVWSLESEESVLPEEPIKPTSLERYTFLESSDRVVEPNYNICPNCWAPSRACPASAGSPLGVGMLEMLDRLSGVFRLAKPDRQFGRWSRKSRCSPRSQLCQPPQRDTRFWSHQTGNSSFRNNNTIENEGVPSQNFSYASSEACKGWSSWQLLVALDRIARNVKAIMKKRRP
ncbi:hypothetical protein TIFTF001_039665 [Ficus carica]|uniref:Uncharacterized protein n=1 Tax=Ficus carica TaxID=3494 RepID=A0AA88JG28_FICCA|nr:hypothetical protein TIFTF001_039665 [Ficus carica]